MIETERKMKETNDKMESRLLIHTNIPPRVTVTLSINRCRRFSCLTGAAGEQPTESNTIQRKYSLKFIMRTITRILEE